MAKRLGGFKTRIEDVIEATDERGKTFQAYRIQAQASWTSQEPFIIFRRYSQFVDLKKAVEKHCRSAGVGSIHLQIPGKTMGGNRKPEIIEARKLGLQKFLVDLSKIPRSGTFPMVEIFFKQTEKDKARAPKERIPKFTQEYADKHSAVVAREAEKQLNLDDPFGVGAQPVPPAEILMGAPGNPFGDGGSSNASTSGPVAGNPFGDTPSALSPPPGGNPFGDSPPPPEGRNPFGDDPVPSSQDPASEAGNPFGGPATSIPSGGGFPDQSGGGVSDPGEFPESTNSAENPGTPFEIQGDNSVEVSGFPPEQAGVIPTTADQTSEAFANLTLETDKSETNLPPGFS